MKIYSIEVETEMGRRSVKLAAPLEVVVPSTGEMSPVFRGLTEVLWGLLREVAAQNPSAPKAEA